QEVALHALADPQDVRRVGLALRAPVPREVLVAAVSILLAVGFVVLPLVGHQVVQGEPVVRGDEVDRRVRPPPARLVDVGGAGEAVRELGAPAGVAPPEPPDAVTVLVVPLRPSHREVPHLVAAGADVPRLRDQLDCESVGSCWMMSKNVPRRFTSY